MKHAKMLGLLAVAAAALMAFAGTASATTVKANGALYTGTLEASSTGVTLHGPADVNCKKSTVKAEIKHHGAATTATGPVNTLTFTECNQHVKVLKSGGLEAHTANTPNGTLSSSGAEVTVEFTIPFIGNVHCIYGTNNTRIGTVTGSTTGNATLDIDSVEIPVVSGSGLCGEHAEWTGTYTVTNPTKLTLH